MWRDQATILNCSLAPSPAGAVATSTFFSCQQSQLSRSFFCLRNFWIWKVSLNWSSPKRLSFLTEFKIKKICVDGNIYTFNWHLAPFVLTATEANITAGLSPMPVCSLADNWQFYSDCGILWQRAENLLPCSPPVTLLIIYQSHLLVKIVASLWISFQGIWRGRGH